MERCKVLVVDDDPILREFAIGELASDMVSVATAEHGLAGLDSLYSAEFDIALVDLDMPVMDGFELLKAVRSDERLQYIPLVVATGRSDTQSIDRAFAAGANSFVVKPLNWRLVAYQLSYVLRNSREEARIRAKARTLRDRLRGQDEIVTLYDQGIEYLTKAVLAERPDLIDGRQLTATEMPALEKVWYELERLRRWRQYGAA